MLSFDIDCPLKLVSERNLVFFFLVLIITAFGNQSVKVAIVCIVSFYHYSYFTAYTCVLSAIAAELRCHGLQLNTRHAPVVFRDMKVAQEKKLHFQLSFNTLRILFTANFISNDKS